MDTRGENPRWVAALVTALPLVLAAALVWYFPPGPRPVEGRSKPSPDPVVARTVGVEPAQPARTR